MQDRAIRLIEYIAEAVGATGMFTVDTHKQGLRPNPNRGLIDCSVLATSEVALWSNLASPNGVADVACSDDDLKLYYDVLSYIRCCAEAIIYCMRILF